MPTLAPQKISQPPGLQEGRQSAFTAYWAGSAMTADQVTMVSAAAMGSVLAGKSSSGTWFINTRDGWATTTKAEIDAYVAALKKRPNPASWIAESFLDGAGCDLVIKRAAWLSVLVKPAVSFTANMRNPGDPLNGEEGLQLNMAIGLAGKQDWNWFWGIDIKAALDAIGVPASV